MVNTPQTPVESGAKQNIEKPQKQNVFLAHFYSVVKKSAGSHPEEGSAGCHLLFGAMLPVLTHTLQRQVKQGAHVNFHFYLEDLKKRNIAVEVFSSPCFSLLLYYI